MNIACCFEEAQPMNNYITGTKRRADYLSTAIKVMDYFRLMLD
jgi:hypothetical protein